jgi:hypothetical protein
MGRLQLYMEFRCTWSSIALETLGARRHHIQKINVPGVHDVETSNKIVVAKSIF